MIANGSKLGFTPVIILGAGRSGTNALRDSLTKLPGFGTWDCDEINAIWRHGNLRWPDDELPVSRVTPKIREFIREQFRAQWRRSGKPTFLVEKTCANTIRVPFVAKIFPEAVFVHIKRNGNAVAKSAMKRWKGELEIEALDYFASKIRYVPISDIPYTGYTFIKYRLQKWLGRRTSLQKWGPQPRGFDAFAHENLISRCALQWSICISKCSTDLASLPVCRVHEVSYEDLTRAPKDELARILAFLEVPGGTNAITLNDIEIASSCIRQSDAVLRLTVLPEGLSPYAREFMEQQLSERGYLGPTK